MATLLINIFYFCFMVIVSLSVITSSQPDDDTNTQFIKTSCSVTQHPALCFQTLAPYADSIQTSPMKIANAALSIALNRTREVSDMVLNFSRNHDFSPREAGAVADCVETMEDSVDKLQMSLAAMKDLNESSEFDFEMSSIRTWVSAALTDETTCMDGVEVNERIKKVIRGGIVNVAKLASIALALINLLLDK